MRTTFLVALLALVPVAACGDDDGASPDTTAASGSSAEGQTITVPALDSLEFGDDQYTATAGEITFVYENEGSLPHTLLIDGVSEDDFFLEVGDTDEGSVELEAGEYVLYCDVPGHRSAGMEADLVVE